MSDRFHVLASKLKPVLKNKSSKDKGRLKFKSFLGLYALFSKVSSIKYIILLISLAVSCFLTYLSYMNEDELNNYNYEKKLRTIDEHVSSAILVNFNLIQSLFAFLNLKNYVNDKIIDFYLSSFDFLKEYKGILSIGVVNKSVKEGKNYFNTYLYTLLKHDMSHNWQTYHDEYFNIMQQSKHPYLFVRKGPFDGSFIYLKQYPDISKDKLFFSYIRFYPLINTIMQEIGEEFNIRIFLVGENITDHSNASELGEKNLLFVKEGVHFQEAFGKHVIKRQFIHSIAGLYWRFEYELPMKYDGLYYQPILIFFINFVISLFLFFVTHYLTIRWLNIIKDSEDLKSELRKNQSNLEEVQSLVHVGDFSLLYREEQFLSWSREMSRLFGIDFIPSVLKEFILLFHEDYRLKVRLALEDLYVNDKAFEIECLYLHHDHMRWLNFRAKNSLDAQGQLVIHGVIMDINDRKQYEDRIYALAFKDSVTDLFNRYHLITEANRILKDPDTKYPVALLFLDLDSFKFINDSLGHTVGDDILKTIAKRLLDVFSKNGFVSRISAHEFAVFLWNMDSGNTIEYLADRIINSIRAPIRAFGRMYHLSATIGISMESDPSSGTTVELMLKHADLAMFYGRANKGKNHYQFYSQEMGDSAEEQVRLADEIHQAMHNQEFVMYYQPRLSLKTLEITGAEALIRWNHPKKGILTPDKFIYLAEEQGSIVDLGNLVMRESCKGALQWRLKGHLIRVAVNLSAKQFIAGTLIEEITSILEDVGLPMHAIEYEITETSAMQNPNTACVLMQQIKALGIKLSLDDFGTAYSSLAYLKRFPLDYLKIDKSFIAGLPSNNEDAAIIRAVSALSNALRLSVIAEGVEEIEQVMFLKDQGIEEVQGYLLARPMPLEEFVVFLDDYNTAPVGDPRFILRDVLREAARKGA